MANENQSIRNFYGMNKVWKTGMFVRLGETNYSV